MNTMVTGAGRPASRGSSGATFEQIDTGTVRKTGVGNGRVLTQGLWLERHAAPSLPVVYGTGELFDDDEYTMEMLTPVPLELMDTRATLHAVADLLQRDVWSKTAEVVFNDKAHDFRLDPLMEFITGEEDDKLERLRDIIVWDTLDACLTHGDPILDNLMLRDGQLVIIDPIPASSALPDLRCLDIGRLMQSAVGYERVRYALDGPQNVDLRVLGESLCKTDNEYRASLYFAVVHCMRSMAYVDAVTQRRIHDECIGTLMEEMTWTL